MPESEQRSAGTVGCPYCGTRRDATIPTCPRCGLGQPGKQPERKPFVPPPPPPTRPFAQEVVRALVYPLRFQGLVVVLGTAVYFTFALRLTRLHNPHLSSRMIPLGVIVGMFFLYTFLEIVQTSAGGRWKFPRLLTGMEQDPWVSLILGGWAVTVSFSPLAVYAVLVLSLDLVVSATIVSVLQAVGCLYLPMALLSVAIWRDVAAVRPGLVLSALAKLPVPNAIAAGLLWTTTLLQAFAFPAVFDNDVPWLMVFAANAAAFHLYLVAARIIGITHHIYHNRIGWFPDRR